MTPGASETSGARLLDRAMRPRALTFAVEDLRELRQLVRRQRVPARLAVRARIVLEAATGRSDVRIARQLGVSRPTVRLWRRRYAEAGLRGVLHDRPRSGRPRIVHGTRVAPSSVEALDVEGCMKRAMIAASGLALMVAVAAGCSTARESRGAPSASPATVSPTNEDIVNQSQPAGSYPADAGGGD